MDIKDSLDKLFSLHNFGVKLGLDNIKKFLIFLKNPHLHLKSIHIAGSNGKGSTSAFISSILQEYNYKVGLYTSPHFVRFNERIKINGIEINDEYVHDFISKYFDFIKKNKITFFEATTAMAFCYFKDNKVDYAVIETGLGGRLDATNVLIPLCSVITGISLEHTHILGKTIKKIAEEKAGIIKNNSLAVIGFLPENAKKVVTTKCKLMNSKLTKVSDHIIKSKNSIDLNFGIENLKIKDLPLLGEYQRQNAAIASLTIYKILNEFNKEIYEDGLNNVIKNTSISGRYEFFNLKPDIIFDSAHNPDGVRKFLSEFKNHSKNYKNKYLLFSALKDKAIVIMLKYLKKEFDKIFLTKIDYDRAANIDYMKKICEELNYEIQIVNNKKEFINKILKGNKDDCLVVLGSMYLLGDLKSSLLN